MKCRIVNHNSRYYPQYYDGTWMYIVVWDDVTFDSLEIQFKSKKQAKDYLIWFSKERRFIKPHTSKIKIEEEFTL